MFLSQSELDILTELSQLHSGVYNEKKGKLWKIGVNTCVISGAYAKKTRAGGYCIAMELRRDKCFVYGMKSKIDFIPHAEYIFTEERAAELLRACDYELKPRPSEMPLSDYLRHVSRRVETFIGTKIKVVVGVYKQLRKDEYGFNESRSYTKQEDIYDSRMKIVSFHKREDKPCVDYVMLYDMLKNIQK